MIDIAPRPRELFLFAALTLCAASASSQDAAVRRTPPAASWDSMARGSFLFHSCRTGRGVSLCLGAEDGAPSPFAARFEKLTRLAGMFMGRVQAATVCGMRLKLTLDIL